MATAESNNGLYFVVGGLVVVAVVFGLYFLAAPGAAGIGVSSSAPSTSQTVEHVSTTTPATDTSPAGGAATTTTNSETTSTSH